MRLVSHLLSALVAVALGLPLLPLAGAAAGAEPSGALWLGAGKDLALCWAPTLAVYLGMKAHLRRDHADGVWAAEAGALSFALAGPVLLALGARAPLLGASALLFGVHLLVIQAHRRSRPGLLAAAGVVGGGALVLHPAVGPVLAVVVVHGLFGGVRHLPRPRFNAVSGRAVAVLGGLAGAVIGGSLLKGGLPALAISFPLAAPEPARLLPALVGPDGLLFFMPSALLALFGLGLWWKRGTRRGFFWVTLAVTLVTLLVATLPVAQPTGGLAFAPLLPLVPFLAGPTARVLSWLRDRPGRRGPRLSGLAFGALLAGGVPTALAATGLLSGGIPAIALGLAMLICALLLPGRASARGRLEALLGALLVAAILAGSAWWVRGGSLPPPPGLQTLTSVP